MLTSGKIFKTTTNACIGGKQKQYIVRKAGKRC